MPIKTFKETKIVWVDIKKEKPPKGVRFLICDEFGYLDFDTADDVLNVHVGRMTWWESWKFGNGTKIVAWALLPEWPKSLCRKDADGEAP